MLRVICFVLFLLPGVHQEVCAAAFLSPLPTEEALGAPRKRYLPRDYSRRFQFRSLVRDTGKTMRWLLWGMLSWGGFYGLLSIAYRRQGGIEGAAWGGILIGFWVVAAILVITLLVRGLVFAFTGLWRLFNRRRFRRRFQRCGFPAISATTCPGPSFRFAGANDKNTSRKGGLPCGS